MDFKDLGYTDVLIEATFIPVMILRSHFDVGHAKITVPNQEQLNILYSYLQGLEAEFTELMNRICDRVDEGNYNPIPHGALELDPSEQSAFDRLVAQIASRRPTASA